MGHCEMLLAVAGLDEKARDGHTRKLAGGDWAGFSPAERAAFAFSRKTAGRPDGLAQGFQQLVHHYGPERAVDVAWWACHCHYMMCVADALQLPLESGNVFDGFPPAAPRGKRP